MKGRTIKLLAKKAKEASRRLALVDTKVKNKALVAMAAALRENTAYIIRENEKDLRLAREKGLSSGFIDRLTLNRNRIIEMSDSLQQIAELRDPVGEIIESRRRPNGLLIKKVRVPIGLILIIYESRPNVTIDVAALCIRSGNVCVLRGGSDALYTNICLVNLIHHALNEFGLNEAIVQLLPTYCKHIKEMLTAVKYIDIIIPRGSQQLIDFVRENSMVPVIETGAGVCHTYV